MALAMAASWGASSAAAAGAAGPTEVERFVEAVRSAMSPTARKRTKPAQCQRSIPPLIARHGFGPLVAAARAFYADPEQTRAGGEFAPGLQVIANDGRLGVWASNPEGLSDAPRADDGLGEWRAICKIRSQTGSWPTHRAPRASGSPREAFRPDMIPPAVRDEFPDLFEGQPLFSLASAG
jgi:hypothetical protein